MVHSAAALKAQQDAERAADGAESAEDELRRKTRQRSRSRGKPLPGGSGSGSGGGGDGGSSGSGGRLNLVQQPGETSHDFQRRARNFLRKKY